MASVSELLDLIEVALRGVFPVEDEMDAAFDRACEAFDALRRNVETKPTETFESGLVREAGEAYSPTAVRWWLVAIDGDGFVFARGGREPTIESAQVELGSAHAQLARERVAWVKRRTHELLGNDLVRRFSHELMSDGSLRPLVPSDFEVAE